MPSNFTQPLFLGSRFLKMFTVATFVLYSVFGFMCSYEKRGGESERNRSERKNVVKFRFRKLIGSSRCGKRVIFNVFHERISLLREHRKMNLWESRRTVSINERNGDFRFGKYFDSEKLENLDFAVYHLDRFSCGILQLIIGCEIQIVCHLKRYISIWYLKQTTFYLESSFRFFFYL